MADEHLDKLFSEIQEFIALYQKDEPSDMLSDFKSERMIYIKMSDIKLHSILLYDNVINNFPDTFELFKSAFRKQNFDPIIKFIPDETLPYNTSHDMKRVNENRLFNFKLQLESISQHFVRTKALIFRCVYCDNTYIVQQDDPKHTKKPYMCRKTLKGVDKNGNPVICRGKVFEQAGQINENFQVIEGIEDDIFLDISEEPQTIVAEYILSSDKSDYISNAWSSQCVQVIGVLKSVDKDYYLQINNIQLTNRVNITPEKEKQIQEIIQSPDYIDEMTKFVIPNCVGYEHLNRLLFLTFIGLNPNEHFIKTKSRQTNIVICGDKGMAKSQMLKGWEKYVPNARYVIGTSITKQGMLASVGMNEILKKPVAKAGLLKLCNDSVLVLDELNNMDAEAVLALNGALSDGKISIHKWGLHKEYTITTNLICISNPKNETRKIDFSQSRLAQIDMDSSTLDRFAVKVFIFDKHLTQEKSDTVLDYMFDFKSETSKLQFSRELVREIIYYCRYLPNPSFPKDVYEKFKSMIKIINQKYSQQKMEFREAEALVKYAMINAKCHGKKYIDISDFIFVFELFDILMWQPIFMETGTINQYIIEERIFDAQNRFPISKSEKVRWIKKLIFEEKEPISFEDIVKKAAEVKISEFEVDESITLMKEKYGEITEVRRGYYKVM